MHVLITLDGITMSMNTNDIIPSRLPNGTVISWHQPSIGVITTDAFSRLEKLVDLKQTYKWKTALVEVKLEGYDFGLFAFEGFI